MWITKEDVITLLEKEIIQIYYNSHLILLLIHVKNV